MECISVPLSHPAPPLLKFIRSLEKSVDSQYYYEVYIDGNSGPSGIYRQTINQLKKDGYDISIKELQDAQDLKLIIFDYYHIVSIIMHGTEETKKYHCWLKLAPNYREILDLKGPKPEPERLITVSSKYNF